VGEFQRSSAELWRIVNPSAALLAIPLTVAVHRTKKPFIYAGFNNLVTDETQILRRIISSGAGSSREVFICVSSVKICG
jgi:hypothetical protein